MGIHTTKWLAAALIAAMVTPVAGIAADSGFTFNADAGIGYDSNVSVEAVGETGEGDVTYHLGAGLGWEHDLANGVSVFAGYDLALDAYGGIHRVQPDKPQSRGRT